MARRYKQVMKPIDEPATSAAVAANAPYESRPLGQALDFLRVLWAINHGLATTSRYMKSKYGVTGRQRLIIQVVNEFPGISAGDLAKVLHLDPSTLTGVLQQMGQRGLLQLQPDMRDRRTAAHSAHDQRPAHEPHGRRRHRSGGLQNAVARVTGKAQSHARGAGAARR